ncbi:peptidoglycan editing factor PgeF [Desmospora profundinema]|uniref:Purine nucleoside phosphorylase n=1 Tax=Desmospora profundinema TaxID=1571184 RepID=A0ABU1IJ56_9BACL|nr:peptidoglycan editing factor PgeF [Desmospora profundinema]MDR6224786.1 YfiH family protein [Desmospora profundinema]
MEPFQYRTDAAVPLLTLTSWEREFSYVVAGMSTRNRESLKNPNRCNYALHVGDDPELVIQQRQQLSQVLNFPFASWTSAEQVHGVRIQEVKAGDRGKGRESRQSAFAQTDGLITREPDILLASFYADCVPILYFCPDVKAVGVAHAGWRGTVGGIGPAMVRELVRMGARRERIRAAIAPSIGACCYEVDDRVASPVREMLPGDADAVLKPASAGKWMLDLRELNRRLLLTEGLEERYVSVTGWCTSCHPEYFHSHRRDRGRTGRMVAFIGLRKDE